jgi:hypothetical protein
MPKESTYNFLVQTAALFEPCLGSYVWGGARSYGSGMNFEFGPPTLHVREPRPDLAGDRQDTVSKKWRSRAVSVTGSHRLWLVSCCWDLRVGQISATHMYNNPSKLDGLLSTFNGQILNKIEVLDSKGIILTFDLDGELKIYLADDYELEDEQFTVITPAKVFSITLQGISTK